MFNIEYKKAVYKDLKGIPKKDIKNILDGIKNKLGEHPFSGKSLKGEYRGYYRIRIGDYRVIYKVSRGDSVVLILRIAQRENIY